MIYASGKPVICLAIHSSSTPPFPRTRSPSSGWPLQRCPRPTLTIGKPPLLMLLEVSGSLFVCSASISSDPALDHRTR